MFNDFTSHVFFQVSHLLNKLFFALDFSLFLLSGKWSCIIKSKNMDLSNSYEELKLVVSQTMWRPRAIKNRRDGLELQLFHITIIHKIFGIFLLKKIHMNMKFFGDSSYFTNFPNNPLTSILQDILQKFKFSIIIELTITETRTSSCEEMGGRLSRRDGCLYSETRGQLLLNFSSFKIQSDLSFESMLYYLNI